MIKAHFKILLAVTLLGLYPLKNIGQSKFIAGLRFIPQSPGLRYNTPFPIADYLKIAPYYSRLRTAQGVGIIYQPYVRWSLATDLLYSMQGGGYAERKVNLNYLKIPIMIGYNASPKRRLMFNIQTGIDLNLLISAKLKYYDGESIDIAEYLNKTSIGVPLAMGFKFKMLKLYSVNTQLYVNTDFRSLSKNNEFQVNNYIIPGLRISINKPLNFKP